MGSVGDMGEGPTALGRRRGRRNRSHVNTPTNGPPGPRNMMGHDEKMIGR